MIVKFKKLSDVATIPCYAKPGDAGMDLYATKIRVRTDELIIYGTDLAVEIPEGYVGLVFPRSSIFNTCLTLVNSVGVIDSGYRGEIKAVFNLNNNPFPPYKPGERIAQLIILPYPKIELIEVEELSESIRGEGGFGHTGK